MSEHKHRTNKILYRVYLALKNVEGPYDSTFNKTVLDIENQQNQGILNMGAYSIPFKTFNIREEHPIEAGYNWFDISIYTAAIEEIFGKEYITWKENPKPPGLLEVLKYYLAKE